MTMRMKKVFTLLMCLLMIINLPGCKEKTEAVERLVIGFTPKTDAEEVQEFSRVFINDIKRELAEFAASALIVGLEDLSDYLEKNSDYSLADYGFENFSVRTFRDGGEVGRVTVTGGRKRSIPVLLPQKIEFPVREDEEFGVFLDVPDSVAAPVEAGDRAGYALLMNGDAIVLRADVVFGESAVENDFEAAVKLIMNKWLCVS